MNNFPNVHTKEILDSLNNKNNSEICLSWQQLHIIDNHLQENNSNEILVFQKHIEYINLKAQSLHDEDAPCHVKQKLIWPEHNVLAQEIYSNVGMYAWRNLLVPSAIALEQIMRPNSEYILALPPERGNFFIYSDTVLDTQAKNFFSYTIDSLAIRSRAEVMAKLVQQYIKPHGKTKMLSLACGAATPVFRAIQKAQCNGNRSQLIDVTLVDIDKRALNFAQQTFSDYQFHKNVQIRIQANNLIGSMVLSDRLVRNHGENSMDIVDALGIFEYFPEFFDKPIASRFLKNTYRLLKPGGLLIIANMLKSHPQLHFNQKVIGWPKIHPRSEQDIQTIITTAGINLRHIQAYKDQHQVYGVIAISKPIDGITNGFQASSNTD